MFIVQATVNNFTEVTGDVTYEAERDRKLLDFETGYLTRQTLHSREKN
jgi:hypothetical protein